MSSKLEDIARAIRQSDIDNGHADEGTELSSYFAPARAAVEAMREPSEAMVTAGADAVSNCYSLEPGEGFDEPPAPAAWQAMIEEILK